MIPEQEYYPYSGNLTWLKNRTVLLTTHGSHAYGLSRPESDIDIKGVAVPPSEYFHGFNSKFEQAESHDPDMVVYDIRKFMSLAADCNPNIIEVLWTDEADHQIVTNGGRALLCNRDLFLSKRARHTFAGYAHGQLKRISTHYRWLRSEIKPPPTRKEMGLPERTLIPKDQLAAAQSAIQKRLDQWNSPGFLDDLAPSTRIEVQSKMSELLSEVGANSADELWANAARSVGIDDNFIRLLDLERQYGCRHKEWEQYQNWKTTRNPARAALEAKHGMDCYEHTTEFLTDSGWKLYDDVMENDKLATLDAASGRVEFQHYSERVSKQYSGKMVHLRAKHTECFVTMNHRMLVSPAHRNQQNCFSWSYDQPSAEWSLQRMSDIIEGRRSYYHVRTACEPSYKELDIDDSYLELIGAYVSEGCVQKRRVDGSASVLSISQKKEGRMCGAMDKLMDVYDMRKYECEHKNEDGTSRCVENVWTLSDRDLVSKIDSECGAGSSTIHLPKWKTGLSARQARVLLSSLLSGDGTKHGDGWVYYTTSKELANDVQTTCVCSGIVSAVWGPYKNDNGALDMYQVFVNDSAPQFASVVFKDRSQSVHIDDVKDVRIVCFTVPNEILITRKNGRVAIHGNTKHAMHLVRLLRMCREILTTGKVIVKRPDRDELLAIRDGAWSYDQLVEWAGKEDAAMDELYANSPLPKCPKREVLDRLCIDIVEEML
jgi:predicted nucleotidyltransferase